jgi:hypothetical protein
MMRGHCYEKWELAQFLKKHCCTTMRSDLYVGTHCCTTVALGHVSSTSSKGTMKAEIFVRIYCAIMTMDRINATVT